MKYTCKNNWNVTIEGCPEKGFEALDWRRARGLPEAMDNNYDFEIEKEITEEEARELEKNEIVLRENLGDHQHYSVFGWHEDPFRPALSAEKILACDVVTVFAERENARKQRKYRIDNEILLSEIRETEEKLKELKARLPPRPAGT